MIAALEESVAGEMQLGSFRCLVAAEWWAKFAAFVQYDAQAMAADTPPGRIDNTALVDDADAGDEARVLDSVTESDYRAVSVETWAKLVEWYGGGPEIRRPVLPKSAMLQKPPVLVLRPLTLRICKKVHGSSQKPYLMQLLLDQDVAGPVFVTASTSHTLCGILVCPFWTVNDLKYYLGGKMNTPFSKVARKKRRKRGEELEAEVVVVVGGIHASLLGSTFF